jgi:hypothetical protein
MALILKRASVSRPSGAWSEDDYDVLADGIVVGRITKAAAAPEGLVAPHDHPGVPSRRSSASASPRKRTQ